jgi:hypothetical protein
MVTSSTYLEAMDEAKDQRLLHAFHARPVSRIFKMRVFN